MLRSAVIERGALDASLDAWFGTCTNEHFQIMRSDEGGQLRAASVRCLRAPEKIQEYLDADTYEQDREYGIGLSAPLNRDEARGLISDAADELPATRLWVDPRSGTWLGIRCASSDFVGGLCLRSFEFTGLLPSTAVRGADGTCQCPSLGLLERLDCAEEETVELHYRVTSPVGKSTTPQRYCGTQFQPGQSTAYVTQRLLFRASSVGPHTLEFLVAEEVLSTFDFTVEE